MTFDAVATFTAIFAAYLALGRYRQQRLQRDLSLFLALSLLALSNLIFSVLPGMSLGSALGGIPGAPIVGGTFTAGLFVVAAFLGERRMCDAYITRSLVAAGTAVGVALVLSWFIGSMFSARSSRALVSADKFVTMSDRGLLFIEIGGAVLFAVAALGWWFRADHGNDKSAAAFGLASAMATLSRLNFASASSPSSPHIITASASRLGFYLALLVGSAVEIRSYWRQRAQMAVLEERRRIARDLHDGLAQELRFAATQSRQLHTPAAKVVLHSLERALDESRRAIVALSRPLDQPVDVAIAEAVEELAPRLAAKVKLDLEPGIAVAPDVRESLLRIAREAVTNAARHAAASELVVRLSNGDGTTLTISDNGKGCDVAVLAHLPDRFGLVSMRERAEALGGHFELESGPGRGTTVKVRVP